MDRWIEKMWYIDKEECYPALQKEENSTICYSMGEPWGHYTKWNKLSQKDKYCKIPLTWGI